MSCGRFIALLDCPLQNPHNSLPSFTENTTTLYQNEAAQNYRRLDSGREQVQWMRHTGSSSVSESVPQSKGLYCRS